MPLGTTQLLHPMGFGNRYGVNIAHLMEHVKLLLHCLGTMVNSVGMFLVPVGAIRTPSNRVKNRFVLAENAA